MKRVLLLILLTIFIGLVGYNLIQKNVGEDTTNDSELLSKSIDGINYSIIENKGIYIAEFSLEDKTIDFLIQDSQLRTTKDLLTKNNADLIFNSSYFQPNLSHAGLLKIRGETITPLSSEDSQLTHIIVFFNNFLFDFIDTQTYSTSSVQIQGEFHFQSGPLVISNGGIQSDLINNSINGNQAARRILLGKYEDKAVIIATTLSYSLEDIASEILELDQYKDVDLELINLDGGSSVSLVSNGFEEFSIGAVKKLPYYLTVK